MTNDELIQAALSSGRLKYDAQSGHVYASLSNTPDKPLGAITRNGYLRTSLYTNGKSVTLMVHRIACIAIKGMPKEYEQVNHINGIKTDNRGVNLEWLLPDKNLLHARDSGLLRPPKHGGHYAAKLTAGDIECIRSSSESCNMLSRKYGVSAAHIGKIRANKRWTKAIQLERRKIG